MNWLSRGLGLAISLAAVIALVVVGLHSGRSLPHLTSDLRNGRVFIQDNLWSTHEGQYAVWVGPNGEPYAGMRRDQAAWRTTDLGRLPGNPLGAPTGRDPHDVYAIGVDAEGGVHIAGNMHGDPLRYVRSAPGRFGDWHPGPAPVVHGPVTYPVFTGLPDGTLLFWCRLGEAGYGRIVLYSLKPGARSWRSLGTVLDGRPGDESPYLNHIAVDPRSGVIHLLFEWRGAEGVEGTNDVGYARSTNDGRSWEKSDGTRLPKPITPASAETVINTAPRGSGLINGGGLTVDAQGRPHGLVVFHVPGSPPSLEHIWLQGGDWRREQLSGLDLEGRPQLAGTPDGRVWLLGVHGETLEAIDITPDRDRLSAREIAEVPAGWEVNYDSQALARFGLVEMLIPERAQPRVIVAPLD